MISMDCSLGICMAINFSSTSLNYLPSKYCALKSTSTFFIAMMNGLLPVGIVLYRVIHVCYPKKVMTTKQRRELNYTIIALTLGLSIVLTMSALYYKDQYENYHKCMGDSSGGSGPVWNLPIWHPHRLTTIMAFVARTLLVPIGYSLIFVFRKKNAREAPGLSENSRKMRKVRNAVNAKFNFLIWLSEMSALIMMISKGPISNRIYIIISFGFSPSLYLIGMEEARTEIRQIWGKFF